jgi:hypothetical protein
MWGARSGLLPSTPSSSSCWGPYRTKATASARCCRLARSHLFKKKGGAGAVAERVEDISPIGAEPPQGRLPPHWRPACEGGARG